MASKRKIDCPQCKRNRPYGCHGVCNSCAAAAWEAKQDPDKVRKRKLDYGNKRRAADPEAARKREREYKKGLPWERRVLRSNHASQAERKANLSLDFLQGLKAATPNCKCCGVDLDYSPPERGEVPDNFATLDRVIPAHGYTVGNVQIVCHCCNYSKGGLTIEDMQMFIEYIKENI